MQFGNHPPFEKVLFQSGKLTVYESQLAVNGSSIYFQSISGTSTYEGKPLLLPSIGSFLMIIPLGFFLLWTKQLFGPYFNLGLVILPMLPLLGFAVFGMFYKINAVFIFMNGARVPVFKGKTPEEAYEVKTTIDLAIKAYMEKQK